MAIKMEHDANAPTATVELPVLRPMPEYDLEEVEARVPRDVDPMLASLGFKDLLDEARGILEDVLNGTGLEISQLTGAICLEGAVFCPGIWLVLRETGGTMGQAMSSDARARVASVARELHTRLGLS